MALIAVALPAPPGKTEVWRRFHREMNRPKRRESTESRRALDVPERRGALETQAAKSSVPLIIGRFSLALSSEGLGPRYVTPVCQKT